MALYARSHTSASQATKSIRVLVCALLLATACAPLSGPDALSPTVSATTLPTATTAAIPTRPAVATSTRAAIPTVTHTPFPPAPTARPTETPIPPSTPTADLPTATVTVTPTPSASPAPECSVLPTDGFLVIWTNHPELRSLLGCPFDPHPRLVPAAWPVQTAYQPFERGEMIWSDHVGWYPQPVIYVLYADSTYLRFEDTFDPQVDPIDSDQTPPPGLLEPAYGFGKVWRDQLGVRERLGWATSPEAPGEGRFQTFLDGSMVWIDQTNQTYVFVSTGDVVQVFDIPFSVE
jgi:hypothetical protein